MNDDELVRRLRDAFDEVHATTLADTVERPRAGTHRPAVIRSWRWAAAAVIGLALLGAALAVPQGRASHVTVPADTSGDTTAPSSPTTEPAPPITTATAETVAAVPPASLARLVAPRVGIDVAGFYGFDPRKEWNFVTQPAPTALVRGDTVPTYTRDLPTSDALAQLQAGDAVDWVWADGRVQHLQVVLVGPYEIAGPGSSVAFVEIHPSVGPALHVWLELQP
jgi:hypothetical protein